MSDPYASIQTVDPEIHELVHAEEKRQADSIRLIPSENYASTAVMEATGSMLTNKYSEGYAGRRYYEGQDYIDKIETLAIDILPMEPVCTTYARHVHDVTAAAWA